MAWPAGHIADVLNTFTSAECQNDFDAYGYDPE